MKGIEEFLRLSPVMPVVIIEDAAIAADLARALVRGGIRVIEVTLRTPAALAAIEAIVRAETDIYVGAGAAFAISPGSTPALLEAGRHAAIPYLPAVATASELMNGLAAGFRCFKFFPAGAAGGIPMLKSFAGPFPDARFCPTGGITQDTVRSYLELPNVLCAGGSWLSPADALAARDWARIEKLAAKAAASI